VVNRRARCRRPVKVKRQNKSNHREARSHSHNLLREKKKKKEKNPEKGREQERKSLTDSKAIEGKLLKQGLGYSLEQGKIKARELKTKSAVEKRVPGRWRAKKRKR